MAKKRKAARMRILSSLILHPSSFTLLLFSACAGDSRDPAMAEGQALYEASCLMCHGETAAGDGPLARTLPVEPPRLMEHLGHHTEARLIQLIRDGIPPAMPPADVGEEEIRLIVDYLWTLVPESEVTALREMQRQMELMSDSAMQSMPGDSAMDDPSNMADTHRMDGMHGMGGMSDSAVTEPSP
jgi:mono/diheme cytochrome c family protein